MTIDSPNTVSLLHFEGGDGSTTFIDESGKVWTAGGSAHIDFGICKYEYSSGYFVAGTSDIITTLDHADFTVGSDDWTVEAWVKLASTGSAVEQTIYAHYNGANNSDAQISLSLKATTHYPHVIVGTGGTYIDHAHTSAVADTNWHHVAAIKYLTTLYVSLDGVLSAGTACGTALVDASQTPSIGGRTTSSSLSLTGWIDEFRFSKGIARYTANFSLPGPFGLSEGVNLYYGNGYTIH